MIETDILIIGSGISGLICALKAGEKQKVTILTKKKLSITATSMAQGGIAAVDMNSGDTFEKHEEDTALAGKKHNNKKTVSDVVKSAPGIIELLEHYGVHFEKDLTLEGGHSHHRIHHTKDTTGESVENALIKAIKKQKNITIVEDGLALSLLGNKKTCTGCQFLKKGKIYKIHSTHTVLATGGAGQVYAHTTNPLVATGDGIAMAHRAGARTKDMEFVQFHPTALFDRRNPHFLLSESLRGEGAILKNEKEESFMKNYDPQADLAPRDRVSQAIFIEQKKGNAYLDISKKPEKWIKNRFPAIYEAVLKRTKKDISKEKIRITPAAHYMCGGVQVNQHGESSISKLYAIGETACTGLHGANRLASNSLLEGAVYGLKVAENILKKNIEGKEKRSAHHTTTFTIASQPFKMKKIRQKIQHIMWEHVGIYRTPQGLNKAIFELERLKQIFPPVHMVNAQIIETRNLIDVSLLIAKAAQAREKSLGCHWIEAGTK